MFTMLSKYLPLSLIRLSKWQFHLSTRLKLENDNFCKSKNSLPVFQLSCSLQKPWSSSTPSYPCPSLWLPFDQLTHVILTFPDFTFLFFQYRDLRIPWEICQVMSLLCKTKPSVMAPSLPLKFNEVFTMAYWSLTQLLTAFVRHTHSYCSIWVLGCEIHVLTSSPKWSLIILVLEDSCANFPLHLVSLPLWPYLPHVHTPIPSMVPLPCTLLYCV